MGTEMQELYSADCNSAGYIKACVTLLVANILGISRASQAFSAVSSGAVMYDLFSDTVLRHYCPHTTVRATMTVLGGEGVYLGRRVPSFKSLISPHWKVPTPYLQKIKPVVFLVCFLLIHCYRLQNSYLLVLSLETVILLCTLRILTTAVGSLLSDG